MKTYLKIKIKSLAAEARIIRAEERKWPGPSEVYIGLHFHRVIDVRREARAAHLAYGFLRGRSYQAIEPKYHEAPNWGRVLQLVSKYGQTELKPDDLGKAIKTWAAGVESGPGLIGRLLNKVLA